MSVKIAVLGSINRDILAKASRLPKVGETVEGFGTEMFIGGKGSNQSVQAAELGAQTHFIGCVGQDENGAVVKAGLAERGVEVDYLKELEGQQTGNCILFVDTQGDNMLVYSPGTNRMIMCEDIDEAKETIQRADILITQNEINIDAMQYGLEMAKNAGVKTLLNPAPAVFFPPDIFELVDYITPNETESEVYTGLMREDMPFDKWARENAQWFLQRGVGAVCITLGDQGAYYFDGNMEMIVPAFQIKAVDTTAAGDAFNAGFAFGIANEWEIEKTIQLANACGAKAATSMGAQNSICSWESIQQFLQEQNIMM